MIKLYAWDDITPLELNVPPDTTCIIVTPHGGVYACKKIATTTPVPKARVFTWDDQEQEWVQT